MLKTMTVHLKCSMIVVVKPMRFIINTNLNLRAYNRIRAEEIFNYTLRLNRGINRFTEPAMYIDGAVDYIVETLTTNNKKVPRASNMAFGLRNPRTGELEEYITLEEAEEMSEEEGYIDMFTIVPVTPMFLIASLLTGISTVAVAGLNSNKYVNDLYRISYYISECTARTSTGYEKSIEHLPELCLKLILEQTWLPKDIIHQT